MAHEAKHHISDTERLSYVNYINKTFEGEDVGDLIPIPIDGQSPTELFEVASDGILLCKLVNKNFPSTIPEKAMVLKQDKNKFEKNLNNELVIKAAKDLGCSVVNIGPQDLTDGTPTLVSGLLWQIIKKSLLKSVNIASNPELLRLRTDADEALENMAPEQVLLQWMNYHLKKAGHEDRVKNFTTDIANSINYSVLLRQIAPEHVSAEDVEGIKNDGDLTCRAEKVIALAEKVIGDESSIFVYPEDITGANPRLNLAFTASLFNSHPALGPTEEEIAAVESEVERLKREKEELLSKLSGEIEQREQAQQALTSLQSEFDQVKEKSHQLESQLEVESTQSKERGKLLEETTSQLEVKREELTQKAAEVEKWEKEASERNEEIKRIEKEREEERQESAEALRKTKEQLSAEKEEALVQAKTEKEKAVTEITQSKDEVIEGLKRDHQNEIDELKKAHQEEIERLKMGHQEEIEKLKKEHQEELERLKKLHQEEMEKLAKEYEDEIANAKHGYEAKIAQLMETVQRLNDMLPDRSVREGWLVKQGGHRKTWKKRYFILKTNFVCYYKDSKNLKRPQGVIDLNDCKLRRVGEDETKKKYVFEISTARRDYLCKGSNEEEVLGWMTAIEKARARFKSDAAIRKTFLLPTTIDQGAEHLKEAVLNSLT